MEEQVDAGRVKYIGLSNFYPKQVEAILKNSRIKPVNLQLPLNLYGQQNELVDLCKKNNITVVAYHPLGGPNFNKDAPHMLEDEVLKKVATKYNKTPAQIVLRYAIQRGVIPIPKSSNADRLRQNFSVFDFTLAGEDMKVLAGIDQNIPTPTEERRGPPPNKKM